MTQVHSADRKTSGQDTWSLGHQDAEIDCFPWKPALAFRLFKHHLASRWEMDRSVQERRNILGAGEVRCTEKKAVEMTEVELWVWVEVRPAA